uniref:Uncharacterized protein n=1 Tax=Arundo donax TaxID=35708 RepID=A0A0A9HWS5_ARUDO
MVPRLHHQIWSQHSQEKGHLVVKGPNYRVCSVNPRTKKMVCYVNPIRKEMGCCWYSCCSM